MRSGSSHNSGGTLRATAVSVRFSISSLLASRDAVRSPSAAALPSKMRSRSAWVVASTSRAVPTADNAPATIAIATIWNFRLLNQRINACGRVGGRVICPAGSVRPATE